MSRAGEVIRLSPPHRATVQRVTLPLLVLLSATMIILGKADQVMFESLAGLGNRHCRSGARRVVAPARCPRSSRGSRSRLRRRLSGQCPPRRGEREAAAMAAGGAQACLRKCPVARAVEADPRTRGNLYHGPRDRQFGRRLRPQPDGQCRQREWRRARPSRDDRRGPRRTGVGGREAGPRGSSSSPTSTRACRSSSRARSSGRCWPATIPSVRAFATWIPALRIKIGDRVVTSGQGGVFPPGLPVGVVASARRRDAARRALRRAVAGRVSADRRLWARRRAAQTRTDRAAQRPARRDASG